MQTPLSRLFKIIAFLSFVFCSACSKTDNFQTDLFVAAELQAYFDAFAAEGASRGVTVDFTAAQIEGYLENIETVTVAGQCQHNSDMPDRLVVDRRYWLRATEVQKEFLIFHELGHCYLNRSHLDEVTAEGTCKSIMQSGTGACKDDYNAATRAAYLDELFE